MKLKDALDLKVGDLILCNACECDYVEAAMKKSLVTLCGCLLLYHEGNPWALLKDARDCIKKHRSCWGLLVSGNDVELLKKV